MILKNQKTILFICLGNACRSIMAEAIVNDPKSKWKKKWRAISAGVRSIHYIPPHTFHALEEIQVPTNDSHSKQLTQKLIDDADHIIVLDKSIDLSRTPAGLIVEKPVEHWDIRDPYRESGDVFREVRDELQRRINQFMKENNLTKSAKKN